MSSSIYHPPTSESYKRTQTRLRIQTCALELFERQGYDHTTVEQIAASANVSSMTFFRYFPTKDAVIAGNYHYLIAESFESLPTEGTIIDRIETVVTGIMPPLYDEHKDTVLTILKLTSTSTYLQGLAAQQRQSMITDVVRLFGVYSGQANYFHVQCVVAACFGIIHTSTQQWCEQQGEVPIQALLNEAFVALREESKQLK